MPQQTAVSGENNFIQGYKTEFTGLNFPENAATDTANCIFQHIGNVIRRPGINYEENYSTQTVNRTNKAINTYRWLNVGGDGQTQVLVVQIGGTLYFYSSASASVAAPLSTQLIDTIDISVLIGAGGTFNPAVECQFTDGNGYLFVFHPTCDPFYCIYDAGSITAFTIDIKVRDFVGIFEDGVADNFRPTTLTDSHRYNLQNQGWTSPGAWTSVGSGLTPTSIGTGSRVFAITSEEGTVIVTDVVTITFTGRVGYATLIAYMTGAVTAYTPGVSITVNVTSYSDNAGGAYAGASVGTFGDPRTYSALLQSSTYLDTWFTGLSNYPSNSDAWWYFKDSSDVFSPATTFANVTIGGPAPKGHFILSAFNQQRDVLSGVSTITDVTTTVRPRTGTWFAGRVWYAGVDASQQATGTAPYTTWTENIYFSQIIERKEQFGKCHQLNDPTSETAFDLLPTDGGVIVVQGSGSIYKLFPVQNGLLVFAANGIWLITGSQGIGFAANDYTIAKVSGIQSISSTSYVDMRGMPVWWNAEGIYTISLGQEQNVQFGPSRGTAATSGLVVQSLTYASIQSFYQNIPITSIKYARGEYDPLDWTIRWIFKSDEADDVTDRYRFDSILVYNTTTQAFSPWTVANSVSSPYINGLNFVQSPGGTTAPDPIIKYLVSIPFGSTFKFTFAEENDPVTWTDWTTPLGTGLNYDSYFVTGYKIPGKAQMKSQICYLYMYSNNEVNTSYRHQGVWSYAISGNSGKYTSLENIAIIEDPDYFSNVIRRHRIRGRGQVYQFKVTSVDGEPFNIIGWSINTKVNTGV